MHLLEVEAIVDVWMDSRQKTNDSASSTALLSDEL